MVRNFEGNNHIPRRQGNPEIRRDEQDKSHTYSHLEIPNRPLINPNLSFIGEVKTIISDEMNCRLFVVRMATGAGRSNEGADEMIFVYIYQTQNIKGY